MEISKSDIIFKHQIDSSPIPDDEKAYFGGIKGKDGIKSQMSSYIDGYKEAVNAIFDRFTTEAKQGNIGVQDTIVFPLIYTHRHCVELELKRLFCLSNIKLGELQHNKTHELCELWKNIKDFLIDRASRLDVVIDMEAIYHYIKELDSYDKKAFRFRYPMDTNLDSTNPNIGLINVVTFHKKMNLFHATMEKLFHALNSQVDEWELDKDFKRMFPHCLKTHFDKIKKALLYEFLPKKTAEKHWKHLSEIPIISEKENKRKHEHCQALSTDAKEVLLILYLALGYVKNNHLVSSKSKERLLDILKICQASYNNNNIFGTNIDDSFFKYLSRMVRNREKIIALANEIISLSK